MSIAELPGGVPPIVGASTSATAFIDVFGDGPVGVATRVTSTDEFLRAFGPLDPAIPGGYAVTQFFANGGETAWVVRVTAGGHPAPAAAALAGGLDALRDLDSGSVNLLCVPAAATLDAPSPDLRTPNHAAFAAAAARFCADARCFLLLDPPPFLEVADVAGWLAANDLRLRDSAIHVPRLRIADPDAPGATLDVGPSGAVAGVISTIDRRSGVWRAPAGTTAALRGVVDLASRPLTDTEMSALNALGVNVIRNLPGIGPVIWGARTLAGDDAQGGEWRYLPVRRTALFIEQSLADGLRRVVFEPNGEPLWSQVREAVSTFLDELFRSGALQGARPREGYFVKCGTETTTRADIDSGVVNLVVGFAPVRPAEFVTMTIRLRTAEPE